MIAIRYNIISCQTITMLQILGKTPFIALASIADSLSIRHFNLYPPPPSFPPPQLPHLATINSSSNELNSFPLGLSEWKSNVYEYQLT